MSVAGVQRVGLISDIHANRVAFEAVLAELDAVDAIVCAGDLVGYGPSPGACIRLVRRRSIPTVQGNHDRAVAQGWGYESGDEYARRVLDEDVRDWLGALPRERTLFNGRLKIIHDHPEDPGQYVTPEKVRANLVGDEDVLVLGHTHIQHAEHFENGVVVNPGSVGQPRDGDPAAAYAIYDVAEESVVLHRVAYDVQRVQTQIKNINSISNQNARRLSVGK